MRTLVAIPKNVEPESFIKKVRIKKLTPEFTLRIPRKFEIEDGVLLTRPLSIRISEDYKKCGAYKRKILRSAYYSVTKTLINDALGCGKLKLDEFLFKHRGKCIFVI